MMPALLAHLRAEARHRWPVWVAVVLLIGVVGGLVLGSVAGARRTATAFDRMVEATGAGDVLVNPDAGADSALRVEDVEALPGVRRVGVADGVGAVLLGPDGEMENEALVLAQRDPEVFVGIDRPKVVEGTIFDPADPTQLMVTDDVADRHDLEAGDTVTVGTIDFDEYDAWERSGGVGPMPFTEHAMTVAAVVVTAESVVDDEVFAYGTVMLTQAFAREHGLEAFFFGMPVDLAAGAEGVPAFQDAVQALVPGEILEFKTLAAVTDTVERGTHPHVVALLAFAAVVGLAGLVVCGQAVNRQNARLVADAPALRALGIGRRGLRQAAATRALVLATGGGVAAALIAVAVSPVFPLGVARRAEIAPGFDVDWLVLPVGAVGIGLALLGWSAVGVRLLGTDARPRPVRSVGALQRVVRSSGSPVVCTGISAAIAPPSGAQAGSTRGALAGLAVAVGAVVAAMTFGASLAHFVTSPSAYGWPWDAMVALPNDDPAVGDELMSRIEAAPQFEGHSLLSVDQVRIDGHRVPAVGEASGTGGSSFTVVAGRPPAAADEIALGGRTMDQLGVGIGDRVAVGDDGAEQLTVIGQAVFPGVGTYSGADRTELGKGALLAAATLDEVGEGFGFPWVTVDAPDAVSLAAGLASVTEGFDALLEEGSIEVIDEPQRPSDVLNLERVQQTPVVIAAVLSALAGAAFAFVLVSGVRGRRRELALLKTFGFRSRDIAGTVVWQSSVTGLIALVVGVPLGMVAGRTTWSALAGRLGIAPDPQLPVSLLAVPVLVVLLANAVAVVPGWIAARTKPALSLRSE